MTAAPAGTAGTTETAGNIAALAEAEFVVPADHPALAGHFPGTPVVPAVMVLDAAIELARRAGLGQVTAITAAKFRAPLLPGSPCRLRIAAGSGGTLHLAGEAAGVSVLTATLLAAQPPAGLLGAGPFPELRSLDAPAPEPPADPAGCVSQGCPVVP